jgi:hypothetical protein
MTCKRIDLPGGGFVIACSRTTLRPRCSVDGCRNASTKLCDFPLKGAKTGKTCDRRLCDAHAREQSVGVDFCPTHAKMAASSYDEEPES